MRLKGILNSSFIIAVVGALVSIALAIFQWNATQKAELKAFEKQRKEAAYKNIIYSLNGFYGEMEECLSVSEIAKLRFDFSNQMDNCWLYCSDEVVQRTQALIEAVSNESPKDVQTKVRNELFLAIRKEFKPDTTLDSKDYIHLNPVKPGTKCDLRLEKGIVESEI
ncbi:MAG: hypothetical protein R3359_04010 [Marinirhabdus sp.]|nr:hypothetical protein [Marinirhabdus sp.]